MYFKEREQGWSGEEFVGDFSGDVGEAVGSALESEGKFFVVDAEEVEDGCVEVVDVHGVLCGVESDFVGFAVGVAGLCSAADEDGGESVFVVVAAGAFGLGCSAVGDALDHGGSAKLGGNDDES